MPRETDPADLPIELPRSEVARLPLCYQRIQFRRLMPKHVEDKLKVDNRRFLARCFAAGSNKPISKIIE
jgi:uncharacterized protein (DUF2267 family)